MEGSRGETAGRTPAQLSTGGATGAATDAPRTAPGRAQAHERAHKRTQARTQARTQTYTQAHTQTHTQAHPRVAAAVLTGLGLGLGLGLFLAGCSQTGDPPGADLRMRLPGDATLTLGTVDVAQPGGAWVDLRDGADVELAPGAQGGFHVWLLYRTTGLSGTYRVRRLAERLRPGGGRDRVLTTEGVQPITPPAAGGPYQLPDPLPSFMCPAPIGVNVLDAPIELSVSIAANESGALPLIEARVQVRTHCPPEGDPQRDFCLSICKG